MATGRRRPSAGGSQQVKPGNTRFIPSLPIIKKPWLLSPNLSIMGAYLVPLQARVPGLSH